VRNDTQQRLALCIVTALIFQKFFRVSPQCAVTHARRARQKLPGKSVRRVGRSHFDASKTMSSTERRNACHRKNH